MFARIPCRPAGLLLLGTAIVLGIGTQGRGQGNQLGNKGDMEAEFNRTFNERNKLASAQRPPTAADKKLMEITARWFIYRVTWTSAKTNPVEMSKLHEDLDKNLLYPLFAGAKENKNRAFIDQLGEHLAKAFREVLKLDFADNRAAVINAALMLPPVAKLKQEDVGDLLVELLNDPKRHDAVKLYAAKALREFFPARMVTLLDDPKDAKISKKFKRDSERLKALTDFIERKVPAPGDEGELEAIRYLRREAIASLAQIGVPALAAVPKKGVGVEGPVAQELLRVLIKGKGGLEPPTSVAERVEAALGLCQLKDPADVDYDPKLGVYAVGLAFLDYAMEYKKDFADIVGRKNTKKIEGGKIPNMFYRIQSEKFIQGMKDLAANTKGTAAQASVGKLSAEVVKIATTMKSYDPIDMDALRAAVKALAPAKAGQLYKLKGPEPIDPESLVGEAPADGK